MVVRPGVRVARAAPQTVSTRAPIELEPEARDRFRLGIDERLPRVVEGADVVHLGQVADQEDQQGDNAADRDCHRGHLTELLAAGGHRDHQQDEGEDRQHQGRVAVLVRGADRLERLAAGRGQVEDVGELRDPEHRGPGRAGQDKQGLRPWESAHDSARSPGAIPPTSRCDAGLAITFRRKRSDRVTSWGDPGEDPGERRGQRPEPAPRLQGRSAQPEADLNASDRARMSRRRSRRSLRVSERPSWRARSVSSSSRLRGRLRRPNFVRVPFLGAIRPLLSSSVAPGCPHRDPWALTVSMENGAT